MKKDGLGYYCVLMENISTRKVKTELIALLSSLEAMIGLILFPVNAVTNPVLNNQIGWKQLFHKVNFNVMQIYKLKKQPITLNKNDCQTSKTFGKLAFECNENVSKNK